MKFLEIMIRVKETDLMLWPALVDKNSKVFTINEFSASPNASAVKSEQLLTILSLGFVVSILVFIVELILWRVSKVSYKQLYTNFF